MKRVLIILTFCVLGYAALFAGKGQSNAQQSSQCSVENVQQMKEDVNQAQSRCDYAKDDPYEDLICERSEMKIRRKRKELEQCGYARDKGIQRYGNEE